MSLRTILQLSRATRTTAPWRPLRTICLILGTFAVCMAGTLTSMVISRDQLIDVRSQSLLAIPATQQHPATFLAQSRFHTVQGGQLLVVVVEPITDQARVPPGLTRWPEPGAVAVSPAAQRLGVGSMFGPVAQIIGPAGLESANDPRVYVRPPARSLDRSQLTPASGFGSAAGPDSVTGVGLTFLNRLPVSYPIALVLGTLGVAGTAALATAATMGGAGQRRRTLRLVALGMSRAQVVSLRWVESLPAVLTGLVLAAVATGLLLTVRLDLPWLREITAPADLRAASWLLACAPVVACAVALVVLAVPVLRAVRRKPAHTRFFAPPDRLPTAAAILCLSAAAGCIWLPRSLTGGAALAAYQICFIVVALTLASAVAVLIADCGALLSKNVDRLRSPAALTAGRLLQARPRRTARMLGGICLAILVFGQLQLWTSLLSSTYYTGRDVQQAVNNSVLTAANAIPGRQLDSFLATLPATTRPLWVLSAPGAMTISGSCAALSALQISCTDRPTPVPRSSTPQRTRVALGAVGNLDRASASTRPVCTAARHSESCLLLLVSATGQPLSVRELTRTSMDYQPGGLQLQSVTAIQVVGAVPNLTRARWVVLYGAVAIAVLLISVASMLTAELTADARRLSALAAVKGTTRWLVSHATLSIFVPIAGAGVIASLAYYLLPSSMTSLDARMVPSLTLAILAAVSAMLIGAIVAAISVIVTRTTDPLRGSRD